MEIRTLLNRLNNNVPVIDPVEFAKAIANVYKILSDNTNIIHAINLMVQYEASPRGISNLTTVEIAWKY